MRKSRIKNLQILIDFRHKFCKTMSVIIIFDKIDQYYIDLVRNCYDNMYNKINQKMTLTIMTLFALLFIPAGMDAYAEERPFITTWHIEELNKTLEIHTTGGGYNYTIDWGDGIIDTEQTGNALHTYDSAGNYQVSISGDFPRILASSSFGDKLITVDQWGDIEWTSMKSAFAEAEYMNVIATDVPDLSRVTDMSYMFAWAFSFNGDISNWDVSNVTDMSGMFFNTCFNGDISNWDVSNVTNINSMFYEAHCFNSDISNWDVSSVTWMSNMFYMATSFNSDLSNWDVSSVRYMDEMFFSAHSFNGDISNWNVSSVTWMGTMFAFADSFNGDISNWDVSSVIDMSGMLTNTSLSTNNYDKLLDNWSKLPTLQNNVLFDSSSKYCDAGEIGRSILINTYGWRITDAGKDIDENCPIQSMPAITSLIADDPDDPDDLDDTYSRKDTITITFDSDTNTPGGDKVQRKPAIDDMFTFSESLGRAYSGKWVAPDMFVITIHSVNAASPPIINSTTVTPAGITPILLADGLSEPSTAVSPVLSGDFGIIP